MPNYEGMFLIDSARASKDWEGARAVVTGVLERYGAKLHTNDRWDERKLAYPIKSQRRATYYLAYFEAPGDSIAEVRRDLLLTEGVLRFLILAWPEDAPLPDSVEQKRMLADEERPSWAGGGRDERGGRDDRGDRGGERRGRRGDDGSSDEGRS